MQQWSSELSKFCVTPLRVHVVTTKDQHSVLTYQMVVDAGLSSLAAYSLFTRLKFVPRFFDGFGLAHTQM